MKIIIVMVLSSLLFVTNASAINDKNNNRGVIEHFNPESRIVVINHHKFRLKDNVLIVMKSAPHKAIPLSSNISGKEVVFDFEERQGAPRLIRLITIQE